MVLNVSAVDDEMLENDVSYNLTLERTPDLDSRITLDPAHGVLEFADNDGRYNDYMVVQGSGS